MASTRQLLVSATALFFGIGVLGANVAVCEVAAYWPIDEMEGTTIHDISGNNNDGNILGPEWMLLDGRTCLCFDGFDDLVQVNNDPSLNMVHTTMEAIIFLNSAIQGGIVAKWGYGGLSDSYIMYVASGRLNAKIVRDGYTGQTEVTSTNFLPLGEWIHVAATYDGLALRLFVNHQAQGEVTAEGEIASTDNDVVLGLEEISFDSHHYLNGCVDEARVSTEALDPSEFLPYGSTPVQPRTWGTIKASYRE